MRDAADAAGADALGADAAGADAAGADAAGADALGADALGADAAGATGVETVPPGSLPPEPGTVGAAPAVPGDPAVPADPPDDPGGPGLLGAPSGTVETDGDTTTAPAAAMRSGATPPPPQATGPADQDPDRPAPLPAETRGTALTFTGGLASGDSPFAPSIRIGGACPSNCDMPGVIASCAGAARGTGLCCAALASAEECLCSASFYCAADGALGGGLAGALARCPTVAVDRGGPPAC